MIKLQIDGACKGCPFMQLHIEKYEWYTQPTSWKVYCEHEAYCDREVKEGENHVSEIPERG